VPVALGVPRRQFTKLTLKPRPARAALWAVRRTPRPPQQPLGIKPLLVRKLTLLKPAEQRAVTQMLVVLIPRKTVRRRVILAGLQHRAAIIRRQRVALVKVVPHQPRTPAGH